MISEEQARRDAETEKASQRDFYVLDFDPGPICCIECDEEIYSGVNGQVYLDRRNGGYEWITYCAACDFESFSFTFNDGQQEDN